MKLLILLRSILATFLFPVTVLTFGPACILFHFVFQSRKLDDQMALLWGKVCCWMSGVRVEVTGLENIPTDRGCLFLFNHTSFFDVFALAGYIPGLRFGAKIELFDIPIFGHTMKAFGTLPITRSDREKVYQVYDDAKGRFAHKERFALAPEGGRNFGRELFPFKAGPFLFAMSAEAPLVPIVILGAHEALPKGQILFNKNKWIQKLELIILKPVETKGFNKDTRRELQKEIYSQMNPIWMDYYKN